MRDPKRIHEMCEVLEQLWSITPDWRFGQLVVNYLGVEPFYVEDDDVLAHFKKMIAQFQDEQKIEKN